MPARNAVTFNIGWELEAIKGSSYVPEGVTVTHDGSVSGDSLEYILDPSYVGDNVRALQLLRRLTSDKHIRVDRSCGFHVHISPSGMSKEKAKTWAGWMTTLARMVEDEAFESVPSSRRENDMCRRLKPTKHSIKSRSYCRSKYGNDDRYYWINVVEMMRPHGIKTVEVRLLGCTRRFVWLQGWIAICLYLARVSHDLMDDPSGLQWRVEELSKAFTRIKSFMDSDNIKDNTRMSLDMVTNMDLVSEPTVNQNRANFLINCDRIRRGMTPRPLVNPHYTPEQVEACRRACEREAQQGSVTDELTARHLDSMRASIESHHIQAQIHAQAWGESLAESQARWVEVPSTIVEPTFTETGRIRFTDDDDE